MADKNLFKSAGKNPIAADAQNKAGGKAYEYTPKHKLAQIAATGCLNGTYYAKAQDQLNDIIETADNVDTEFVGKTAIYARQKGFMKDMPSALVVNLVAQSRKGIQTATDTLKKVFPQVIDNGRMIRNVVQMIRSGRFGINSVGRVTKGLINDWLNNVPPHVLLRASIGNDPSLSDVIKLCHPAPKDAERAAMFAYLLGKDQRKGHVIGDLPSAFADWEGYKADQTKEIPNVDFRMLSSMDLKDEDWKQILRNALKDGRWTMVRMNLNTFQRHNCFNDPELVDGVADLIANPEQIARARAFPFQLMAAHIAASGVPGKIRDALQTATEIAVDNVPVINGKVYVCPDVSGSMGQAATGDRGHGATSVIRCIDVAALVACAILRKNPDAVLIPFENNIVNIKIDPKAPIIENSKKLARIGGGGTNISAPLVHIKDEEVDNIIFISDNQSWADSGYGYGNRTSKMGEWQKIKRNNPNAKMACIDIQPHGTSQAQERSDILNIGGFSDQVFNVLGAFTDGSIDPNHWVGIVDKIDLDS